jgi:hypothetical protein
VPVGGGQHRIDDVLLHVGLELVEAHLFRVLAGEHDGVDLDGTVLLVVLDGDLGLAVRAEVVQRAVLAHLGELLRQPMGDHDRERHQLGGVVTRVAEHQALVAGALAVELVAGPADPGLIPLVDALRDVRGLLAEGDLDTAGVAVEPLDRGVVADLEDLLANELGDRRVGLGGHLTRDDHETGGQERLAGDPAVGVAREERVQHGVADRVGDLVRVTLGHGLGGEQTSSH